MLESDYKPCRELDICNELNNNTSTPSNSEDTQNINLLDYQHLTESYILGRKCTYMVGLVERGKGIPPVIERVESFFICDTRWGHTFPDSHDKFL